MKEEEYEKQKSGDGRENKIVYIRVLQRQRKVSDGQGSRKSRGNKRIDRTEIPCVAQGEQ